MTKIVSIAALVGFFVGMAWLAMFVGLTLSGHESALDDGYFKLAEYTCPPFFLQLTISAPWFNAGLYALVAFCVAKLLGLPHDQGVN